MTLSEILAGKTVARDEYKSKLSLPRRSKILVAVHFSDTQITQDILAGLEILPANFIVFGKWLEKIESKNISYNDSIENFDMQWIDAIICNCTDISLETAMKKWVVPIVNENNYLGKILQEFHPWRAEGNAYLYEKDSQWSAYYALIRYLENHKFPYDNRNLVKNVVWL